MRLSIFFPLLLVCAGCSREAWYGPESSSTAPRVVDRPPQMLPSQAEGMALLQRRIRYPESCEQAGAEGRVFVSFTVDRYGYVLDPVVTRGIHPSCDEEALRVIRLVEFAPALENGAPVAAAFSLPVTFRLR